MPALVAALVLVAIHPQPALASGALPTGYTGSDISWPQCGTPYPAGYSFGIVGVTGGRPFSANPCFATEYAWAQSTTLPQLYMNLDYGQRLDGPLQCGSADTGCQAYNYGYDAAEQAYQVAGQQTSGATVTRGAWWLDVEVENYWSDDVDQNSYVIQGALDYLQRVAGRQVGVYSTAYQWRVLAGNFAPPNTANWVAGASGLDDNAQCSASLWPGGEVAAIQFLNYDLNLDQDMGC